MTSDRPLDEAEQVEILEALARTGPATARIQAIKLLWEIRAGEQPTGDFTALYRVPAGREPKAG